LLKIDPEGIEKVQSMLTQHNHTIDDCFDNPQALRDTLCKLYGNRYDEIFESILKTLSGSLMKSGINDFIKALRR